MATLKCKMCGGQLDIANCAGIIECEYCGTRQTLPKSTDENVQALFNRANTLRQKNDFDKAESTYEKILEIDDTEAEAYWGVILCKFGIEYVEDPTTMNRVPTCHRTSFESIVADEYYKKAIEHADISSRSIYEQEARKIDEIQKGILAISSREEPYDVFICYKETDANGARTQDSVIANDIYYQLTNEGFKVFYAAITLEDKLGSAYEPVIFAALNSSRVMLVVGTCPEYFNAVWVKNEWSRFLKMMKKDRQKMLIPCYKGMDAYDLPDEFAHLQSQNMDKIGFINDIVRGIKKVIVKEEEKPVVKQPVAEQPLAKAPSGADRITPLLTRMFMFLEDGDFVNAKVYCEKVLDIDPQNAQAYLGALMTETRVRKKFHLANLDRPFDGSANFNKIMRFSHDEALKNELKGYLKQINERRFKTVFNQAKQLYDHATMDKKGIADCENAKVALNSIISHPDAIALASECNRKIAFIQKRMEDEKIAAQRRKEEEKAMKQYSKLLDEMRIAGEFDHRPEPRTPAEIQTMYNNYRENATAVFAKKNKILFVIAIVMNILMFVITLAAGMFIPFIAGLFSLTDGDLGTFIMIIIVFFIIAFIVAIIGFVPQLVFLIIAMIRGIKNPLGSKVIKLIALIANLACAACALSGMIVSIVSLYGIFLTLGSCVCLIVSALVNAILVKQIKTSASQFRKYNTYG